MAAATLDIPAICLNVGPMLNGYSRKDRIGSGTVVWQAREMHAAGQINDAQVLKMVTSGTTSAGHCNTMGTASTMNALAEALGMALPGSAAIPAPYRERAQMAYKTGVQIVEMVYADRKPSDIMTREAFENALVANTAIGGSTNAPIHLNAIAKHIGVPLDLDDWEKVGFHIPLLVNVQPAGSMLCEEYYRAGGLPAVMAELLDQGKLHGNALTCNGKTIEQNVKDKHSWDRETIKAYDQPMKTDAGFLHLTGNLFDSAIMKTSVISELFRKAFLENPDRPMVFESKVAVFDGPEDYHSRIETADIDERTILVMRGTGPIGYPGAAEVVNSKCLPILTQTPTNKERTPTNTPKSDRPRPPPQSRPQILPPLHRRRPPIRHQWLAQHPQRQPRSRRKRKPSDPQRRRHTPSRLEQTQSRHADPRERDRKS